MRKVMGTEAGNGSIRGLDKVTDIVVSVLMLVISAIILLPVVFITVISFTSEASIAKNGYRFTVVSGEILFLKYVRMTIIYQLEHAVGSISAKSVFLRPNICVLTAYEAASPPPKNIGNIIIAV